VFEASTGGHARLAGSAVPLTEVPDKDGYLRVKHQGRWYSVAELVALAWHGAPQVRHLGDSNQDNKPTELAWGSARENERDKRDKRRKGKGEVSPPSQRLQPVTGDVQG
jgi:hypothetical protein